ncbi:DUF5304 family protein [Streptomyces millisiae]|uniref:DUF5304 family protein n=1 Tax=Streptomyces millisiae TaxID=3075542 RepID=A0ABU2M2A5_9ACTN|nr:DUF5304 family protein [Streptomyces sp. DSM 44918]MDT0323517.1 DUF5304 family protein [Streptomyces sp. DSM 44918]
MSDDVDRDDAQQHGARGAGAADEDAWAEACAEDLAAERERRRREHGEPPPATGDAVEELRRLAEAITGQLGRLGGSLGGLGGLAGAGLAAQARAAVEPVLERNAEAIQHLANAGQELLAAYRAAVLSHEQRWTRDAEQPSERPAQQPAQQPETASEKPNDPPAEGPSHRIDLD